MNSILIKLAVFVIVTTSSALLVSAVDQDTQNEKHGIIDPKLKPREREEEVEDLSRKEVKSVENQSRKHLQRRPRCQDSYREHRQQNSENVKRTHFKRMGEHGFHYRIFTGSSGNKAPAIGENSRRLSDEITKAIFKSRKQKGHDASRLSSHLVGSQAISISPGKKIAHGLVDKFHGTTFPSTRKNRRKEQVINIPQQKKILNERRLDSRLLSNKGKFFAPQSKQARIFSRTRIKGSSPSITGEKFHSIHRSGGSSSKAGNKFFRLKHPGPLQKNKNLNSYLNRDGISNLKETDITSLISVLNPRSSRGRVFTNPTRVHDKKGKPDGKFKTLFIGDAAKLPPGELFPLGGQRQLKFNDLVKLENSNRERLEQLSSMGTFSKIQSFDLQALSRFPTIESARRPATIETVLFDRHILNSPSEVLFQMEQDFVQNPLLEVSPLYLDDFELVYFMDDFPDSVLLDSHPDVLAPIDPIFLSDDQFTVLDFDELGLNQFSNPLPSSFSSFEVPNFDLGTSLYNNPIPISGDIIDSLRFRGFGGDFSGEDLGSIESSFSSEFDSIESITSRESGSSESKRSRESDSSESRPSRESFSSESSSSKEYSSTEGSFEQIFEGFKDTGIEVRVLGTGILIPNFESSHAIQEAHNSFRPSSSIDYNEQFSDHEHLLGGLTLEELFHRDIQNGRGNYGFRRKKSIPLESQEKNLDKEKSTK